MTTDEPTVTEYANGSKRWHVNGKLHRLDGPAIEYANGSKHWYANGVQYSLADYLDLVSEDVLEDIVLNHLPGF